MNDAQFVATARHNVQVNHVGGVVGNALLFLEAVRTNAHLKQAADAEIEGTRGALAWEKGSPSSWLRRSACASICTTNNRSRSPSSAG